MNTRTLRGIRTLRDVIVSLNNKRAQVVLVPINPTETQQEFVDTIVFSLAPDMSQDVLITGKDTLMEVRLNGNRVVSAKRTSSKGFKVKLKDDKYKWLLLLAAEEQDKKQGGE